MPNYYQKILKSGFSSRVMFYEIAQVLPYIWAAFEGKNYHQELFKKSPNLVTLPVSCCIKGQFKGWSFQMGHEDGHLGRIKCYPVSLQGPKTIKLLAGALV